MVKLQNTDSTKRWGRPEATGALRSLLVEMGGVTSALRDHPAASDIAGYVLTVWSSDCAPWHSSKQAGHTFIQKLADEFLTEVLCIIDRSWKQPSTFQLISSSYNKVLYGKIRHKLVSCKKKKRNIHYTGKLSFAVWGHWEIGSGNNTDSPCSGSSMFMSSVLHMPLSWVRLTSWLFKAERGTSKQLKTLKHLVSENN